MSVNPEGHLIPWGIFAADLILPCLPLREWLGTTRDVSGVLGRSGRVAVTWIQRTKGANV